MPVVNHSCHLHLQYHVEQNSLLKKSTALCLSAGCYPRRRKPQFSCQLCKVFPAKNQDCISPSRFRLFCKSQSSACGEKSKRKDKLQVFDVALGGAGFFSERGPSVSEGWLSEEIKKPRGRGLGRRNTNKSI